MGMVGLRDVLVVAPAGSFHSQYHEPLPSSAEHPIIPLLTAAPCLVDEAHDGGRPKPAGGIHLWQTQPPPPPQNPNSNPNPSLSYHKKPIPMLDAASILGGAGGIGAAGGGGPSTCQDCGNQAKKDCSHRRCRTCCKSRGFDCSTHVKSTWVPAARRRERQFATSVAGAAAGSSASTSAPKKPRLITSQTTTTASHTSTSNTTPPRSFDTSSSHQDATFRESLPGHVRAPAVFKCVRVTSMDDGKDEYAYQAMVKIGGHVFKGFLYDQGVDDGRGEASTSDNAIPNISELHLGGAGTAGGGRNGSSSAPMIPSDDYGGGGGGLFGGTANYGNPIN
ncbi:protein LATERAL ROOT PRIMORDIUM 1 [Elaeis guineensis]|uniref:Protein LATERAL ROOT PRIMORDIUM 1 n=1 Tax=Elaeis guineensis var. tenera TaxID=51953 RepID=A0A6I9SFE0_ELAGV|nr:protein LATERAL ROOT PRIMORDIUM 1 [Elaeis guineensis]